MSESSLNNGRRKFLKLTASGVVVAVVAGVGAYLALQQPQRAPAPAVTPAPRPAPSPVAPTPSPPPPASVATPSPTPVTPKPAPSPTPTLVEKAKAEGSVMVYNPMWVAAVEAVKKGFEAKYPGIKFEYVRGFTDLIERALAESRAGKRIADVHWSSYSYMLPIMDEGLVASYTSSEDAAYPSELRDPQGRYVITLTGLIGITYSNKLSQDKIPTSYFDLLKPHFSGGRIAIWNPNGGPYWWWNMKKRIIGEEKWMSWNEGLKKQNPKFMPSASPMITLLTAGEADLAVGTYLSATLDLMKKGTPVDYVKAKGTIAGDSMGVWIDKNAPHPNAARLLRDYLLTEECIRSIVELGNYIPLRPGIPSYVAGIEPKDVILPPVHTVKDLRDVTAEFNKLFAT